MNVLGLVASEDLPEQDRWRARAACRGQQHLFFTPHVACRCFPPCKDRLTKEEDFRRVMQAKAVCANCPVRTQCLEWALEHDEKEDIWGGYTERERKRMIKSVLGSRRS